MNSPATTDQFRNADGSPNVATMQQELQDACTHASSVVQNMVHDENARYAKWAGQQDDGRKPETIGGKLATPWPYSSDVRIRLGDEIVNDHVKLMKATELRANLTVRGRESADAQLGGKTQVYMDWLRGVQMRANVARETELAAQWRQTHAVSVTAITWQQEWARDYETITVQQIQQAAMADPQGPAAQILSSLYDTDREVTKALAAMLTTLYPDLDRGEAYSQLRALRVTGSMEMPVRYLRCNTPRWDALKLWRDIFVPANTGEEQRARWIAWRRTLTEAEVDEKALSEEWSDDFIAAVKKTKGSSVLDGLLSQQIAPSATSESAQPVHLDSAEQMEGLCEVFYFYYTHIDEKGVPCKYSTVISPHVVKGHGGVHEDVHGPDKPIGYEHGLFPFVFHRRERPDSLLVDSRGVPSLVLTSQQEIKNTRDARINQTELFLQPPTIRPEREVGLPLTIRPRGEIGERRAQTTRQMSIPNTAPAGQPLEMDAQRDADRYFARNRMENPTRSSLYDQDLVNDWCAELALCWRQTLQLAQQFESEQRFTRIVGGRPVAFHVTRDEIQGSFDLQLTFNTDALDPAKMEAKAKLAQAVIGPMDRFGMVNWAPIVRVVMQSMFPEIADEALRTEDQAAEAEIKDEQNNWSLMMAGSEPPMAEDGQNFQLRLQWLEQQEALPGSQKRLAQNPDSQELVAKRKKHFEFQLQQRVNAQTGRVGVEAGPAAAA